MGPMAPLTRRAVLALGGLAATGLLAPHASADAAPATGGRLPRQVRRAGSPTDLERHDRDNLLVVVTKDRPLDPVDYAPDDLVDWRDPDYQLRAEVADQLSDLFDAAQEEGHRLRVISGYRSHTTQRETYDYWVRTTGRKAADATSARPGHSEHQTGLAVDLDNDKGTCYLDQCFGDTAEGRWLAEEAHRFGFVISYPEGQRERTGYTYEPWHVRYVGPTVAGDMHREGFLLLEDYLAAEALRPALRRPGRARPV